MLRMKPEVGSYASLAMRFLEFFVANIRICFRWNDGGADDVEIVDYH